MTGVGKSYLRGLSFRKRGSGFRRNVEINSELAELDNGHDLRLGEVDERAGFGMNFGHNTIKRENHETAAQLRLDRVEFKRAKASFLVGDPQLRFSDFQVGLGAVYLLVTGVPIDKQIIQFA